MKLGILLAGRRPEDIAKRLEQAREGGFSLCQLNLLQTGLTRADLVTIVDQMLEYGVRPVALGCYVNPLRPDDFSFMGACRADLDLMMHNLDIIGARRVVIWSGTHAETLYEEHPENGSDDSLTSLREFVTDVVRNTRARRYSIVIEPWRTHVLNHEDRVLQFHNGLAPDVAERVCYVLDVPNLMTPERYAHRDSAVRSICGSVGPLAGVVHLKDVIMPPDGDESLAAPGQGKLDYEAYIAAILRSASDEIPAIVKNVPAPEFGSARDYLLQLSDRWELA